MKSRNLALFILAAVLGACALLSACSGDSGGQSSETSAQQGVSADPAAVEDVLPKSTTPADAYPLSAVTDDMLVLVNKELHMTRDYVPSDMVAVSSCDPSVGTAETRVLRQAAAEALEELIAGAAADGFSIVMRTGYRSYDYQEQLFAGYAANHGEEAANTYSARAGQSEHQTGLCCDVGVPGKDLTSFNGSQEAKWIADNCHRYGFILRYPEGKTDITGYTYESWHIRYVGTKAAGYMYENAQTLEEYLSIAD